MALRMEMAARRAANFMRVENNPLVVQYIESWALTLTAIGGRSGCQDPRDASQVREDLDCVPTCEHL